MHIPTELAQKITDEILDAKSSKKDVTQLITQNIRHTTKLKCNCMQTSVWHYVQLQNIGLELATKTHPYYPTYLSRTGFVLDCYDNWNVFCTSIDIFLT